MSAEIVIAIISSVGSLIGVIITVRNGNSKTLYRIDQLEKKQDEHNNLIRRMYDLESRVSLDEKELEGQGEQIKRLAKYHS